MNNSLVYGRVFVLLTVSRGSRALIDKLVPVNGGF